MHDPGTEDGLLWKKQPMGKQNSKGSLEHIGPWKQLDRVARSELPRDKMAEDKYLSRSCGWTEMSLGMTHV